MVGEDVARPGAFKLLQRDHLRSEKLGPLCQRISYGLCEEYETFLRATAEKSPHKAVRATASLSLGRYLNNRLQRIDLCRERPDLAKQFGALYGEGYVADLLKQDRGKAVKEVEAVFEQAAEKYGDVKLDGETIAYRAKAELLEVRHL